MSKRSLATVLWFAMGWTIGSILAIAVGLPSIVGLPMGIPFALMIRGAPARRRIWSPDELAAKHERTSAAGTPIVSD